MTTDAEILSAPRVTDAWASAVYEQLQTFNTELGQLNDNIASVVAQTGTPVGASAEQRNDHVCLPSKPLAVRVDETIAAIGEQIQNLTDNVARLASRSPS